MLCTKDEGFTTSLGGGGSHSGLDPLVVANKEWVLNDWIWSGEITELLNVWGFVVSRFVGMFMSFTSFESWHSVSEAEFSWPVHGDRLHGGSLPHLVLVWYNAQAAILFAVSQFPTQFQGIAEFPHHHAITNYHLSLPDLVDCPFTIFLLIWIPFMQLEWVKRDTVFLTVVHVINGSVPHTLLAPLTNSLVVVVFVVAAPGADPSVFAGPDLFSSPEDVTGALLGQDRCWDNFCLTVRRGSRGFVLPFA